MLASQENLELHTNKTKPLVDQFLNSHYPAACYWRIQVPITSRSIKVITVTPGIKTLNTFHYVFPFQNVLFQKIQFQFIILCYIILIFIQWLSYNYYKLLVSHIALKTEIYVSQTGRSFSHDDWDFHTVIKKGPFCCLTLSVTKKI